MVKEYKKWTDETLAKEAKKYKHKSDFQNNSPSAYMLARKRGIFDKITKHMVPKKKLLSKADIKKIAKKYKTKKDFYTNDPGAYNAARREGILAEVTAHMPSYSGIGKKRGPNKVTLEKMAAAK